MRNLILKWLMGSNEFKAWRQIMAVDTGIWLGKNQKEVDAKIQNLDSDGNLSGNVTGTVTGNIVTQSIASGGGNSMTISAEATLTLAPTADLFIDNSLGDVFLTDNLPTTDPTAFGQLWSDPSAGYAIKVSQG
jgi:hypothetical protein